MLSHVSIRVLNKASITTISFNMLDPVRQVPALRYPWGTVVIVNMNNPQNLTLAHSSLDCAWTHKSYVGGLSTILGIALMCLV